MIHVYGVTHAGAELPEGLRGLGGRPVRSVVEGDIAAVVTDLDELPRSRADLEAHAEAQATLASELTVVPVRFGTLMDDEAELREGLLGRHADDLHRLLESVEGRVQMTLKAVYEEDVMLREAIARHPELKRESDRLQARGDRAPREALINLGERIARAVAARRTEDEDALVARVEPIADRVLVEEPGHERIAARLQLLVRRERREELDAAVAALAAEQEGRMTLRYVGPLAPYSFCDVSLDPGAAAWA